MFCTQSKPKKMNQESSDCSFDLPSPKTNQIVSAIHFNGLRTKLPNHHSTLKAKSLLNLLALPKLSQSDHWQSRKLVPKDYNKLVQVQAIWKLSESNSKLPMIFLYYINKWHLIKNFGKFCPFDWLN